MNKKRQPLSFPADNQPMRNRGTTNRKADLDQTKKYDNLSRNYLNEQYTHQCHKFIKNICKISKNYIPKYIPIEQILIAVSKKLLLNQLQFLFLNCLIEQLKWEIMDQTVKNHAMNLKSLLKYPSHENQQYKCLELYILLSAYAVKVYLNEDIKIFQAQMNQLLPKFQQVFMAWGNKFAKNALSTNPKKLNRKYAQYTIKQEQKQLKHEDLNQKVNQLLENTPNPQPKLVIRNNNTNYIVNEDEIQQYNHQANDDQLKQLPLPTFPSKFQNSYFQNMGLIRQPSDLLSLISAPGLFRINSTQSDYGLLKNIPSYGKDQ